MKRISLFLFAAVLTACATVSLTPEEKAARDKNTREAIDHNRFTINVTSMSPARGDYFPVSGGWLKLDSNMVDCNLPYIGLDEYPRMKTEAEIRWDSHIEFKGEMMHFLHEYDPENDTGHITFSAYYSGDTYQFEVFIQNIYDAKIVIQPESRDGILYEGTIPAITQ